MSDGVSYASLLELGENWDSYGASPITPESVAGAERVANVVGKWEPRAVPTPNGGVQLEWTVDGVDLEIEIGPDGKTDCLFGLAG